MAILAYVYVRMHLTRTAVLLLLMACGLLPVRGEFAVADHTSPSLQKMPSAWVQAIKNKNWRIYYMYRSHGQQLTYGLEKVAAAQTNFAFAIKERALPNEPQSLNMFGWYGAVDGSALPQNFWLGESGRAQTRQVLSNNPTINMASWAPSGEMRDWSAQETTNYLTSMGLLEAEFTNVVFVYMTANTQAWDDGANQHHTYNDNLLGSANQKGLRTHQNNEIVRKWCRAYGKVLLDYGDIDSWYSGVETFSSYNGQAFPREHDHYNIDQIGHTSYENATNKAVAFWWLLAQVSGLTPPKLSISESEGTVQVEFTAIANTSYAIEVSSALATNDWRRLITLPPKPQERTVLLIEEPSLLARFYRVQVLR